MELTADYTKDCAGSLAPDERALLLSILAIQSTFGNQHAMCDSARAFAEAAGATVMVVDGNLYARKGEVSRYPCFVAHLDTVHEVLPAADYEVVHDAGRDRYFAMDRRRKRRHGVGGDDKCGIFIALQMLRDLDACKVLLCRDEEAGCQGAESADLGFFADCAFVIEADAPGRRTFDVATRVHPGARRIQLSDGPFRRRIAPLVRAHGYSWNVGGGTDISRLKARGLSVPCANIACGYYRPHQASEFVVTADLARALSLVRAIATSDDALGSGTMRMDRQEPRGRQRRAAERANRADRGAQRQS